jgi:N-acetyl-anhydromuramyl-L-alanine amidase AmpD
VVDTNRDTKLINKIILHCSDTDLAEFDNIESIRKWHLEKKWSDIGYHFFIDKKGKIFDGRPIQRAGAHCAGQNLKSIGICVSGRKTFYDTQFRALRFLVQNLMDTYKIKKSEIYPHCYYNQNKTCPNFPIDIIWANDSKK